MITHTIDQFILNPKSILLTSSSQNKVKAEKLAQNLKFQNFVINLTCDTPSNGSDYLWQTCMEIIDLKLKTLQSGYDFQSQGWITLKI